MTNLISVENVSLAYGLQPLLEQVKLQVTKGERIALIGRNGAGKSSLLKVIDGSVQADSGTVWRKPGLRIARLVQDLPQTTSLTVFEFVAEGLAEIGKLLADYHALTQRLTGAYEQKDLLHLERLQQAIDAKHAWHFEQTIKTTLTRLSLNGDVKINELSGGWQRRAALAKALVSSPDLLLLDEPTNHLDIEVIQWLEEQLLSLNHGLIFITHDRALLQRLATRIIELDRGKLTSWPGNYQHFLLHKEELLQAEAKQQADFDKKLAQEEKWIRQGIKARRTRNEGRVRALKAMRDTRSKRRELIGKVNLHLNEAAHSGDLVIEAKELTQTYQQQCLIKHFSLRIMRGDRIGLIGPNGVGKSTLLNILLGHISPQQGQVILGTKLEMAYFDQRRQALDSEKTVIENVTQGSDTVEIKGEKRHVISYLSDFLFTPERSRTPVKALSGGECNRLLLARLFSRPSNLLVMDEPTNDLDIETLELLEELLLQYQGTLLVVSHDREFLDNVVTSTLVFEGEGKIQEYVGGYHDWLVQRKTNISNEATEKKLVTPKQPTEKNKVNKKLSYKEQLELKELPARIEKLEMEQAQLGQLVAQADFYQQTQQAITQTLSRLSQVTQEIEIAYARWNELEKL
ncbi:MAG: ATP-binding cassette domain-containing protein [Gammaproteobacteria bacterium]|nr:ATP-binding cassette domain-containing protein [Gammaproteobacteria bacterium]